MNLKPCGRCEQELPMILFDHKDAMFCKQCTREIADIISKKYNTIEAAVIRAKLRQRIRKKHAVARTG